MIASAIFTYISLATLVTLCHGQGQDAAYIKGAFGSQIVESVITRIRSNCIFSEDRLFLRRNAYVMSRDGHNSDTYRAGFDGGIWQVPEPMFIASQDCNNILLMEACANISSGLSIDWPSTTWSDLRMPLYSGVAAAMSSLLALGGGSMSGDVSAQAVYWAGMYSLPKATFIAEAPKTPSFQCKDKLDLVFILDSSGSVSVVDFDLMLAFAADVVQVMNVSQSGVRIADIVYSSYAAVSFDFDDQTTKAAVNAALRNTLKIGGGTNTAAGLKLAQATLFSASSGARTEAKKVAVLITDGRSNSFFATSAAARDLKNNGTTVFAVGVGNYRLSELQTVASDPVCSHVLTLTNFGDITSILTEIQKSTCEANYKITEDQPFNETDPSAEPSVTVTVPGVNKTVAASVECGILNIYVSTTDPRPGPAVFDHLYRAIPDGPAVISVVDTLPQGTPVYITVVGTSLPPTAAALRNCQVYRWSLGVVPSPDIKVTCEVNGVIRPCTKTDISFTDLCPEEDPLYGLVENPCTTENLMKRNLTHRYPYDPTKFIMCDMLGHYYITLCPNGAIFNPNSEACGFVYLGSPVDDESGNVDTVISDSDLSSSCTPEKLAQNKYYHTYAADKTKFIQCNEWGRAFLMPCAPGTQWSQSAYTCVRSSISTKAVTATNATPTTATTGSVPCNVNDLLPYPCDHRNFYSCVSYDRVVLMHCPTGLYFNPATKVCDWTDTNPEPIPSSCPPV